VDLRLKELIEEATQALSQLDAERLDELALSCQALNRGCSLDQPTECAMNAGEARQAIPAMHVFSRVLEATRTNLEFMNRLNKPGCGRLEYRTVAERKWESGWIGHGNH
jgi:hypothetical protein